MAKSSRSLSILLAVLLTAPCVPLTAARKRAPRLQEGQASPTPAPRIPAPTLDGELPLAAKGAIVIDAFTGETLYQRNADEPQFPASTTKIMTALLVIEAGDLDREVEVTLEDSKVGESSLELKPGQRFTRRQMLYGLMLKSANDVAADGVGRDNAGSIEAFAQKMNQRAIELGATSTHFVIPRSSRSR